jgi:hypothetical protein
MINKTFAIYLAGVCLFPLVNALAEEKVPEIVYFQGNPEGGGAKDFNPSANTGQVVFLHTKHSKQYTKGCGACHRDEEREPIKAYDPVEIFACIECHDGEGSIIYPIAEDTNSEVEFIENRADAIHMLCVNCHKNHNAKKQSEIAPEVCRQCHK